MNWVYCQIPVEGSRDMQEDEIQRLNKALENLQRMEGISTNWDNMSSPMAHDDSIYISSSDCSADHIQGCTIDLSNIAATTTSIYTSPSVTIGNLTTSQYTQINLDDYANVTLAQHNELINRVEKLEKIMEEEAELRAQHPALKMAYDEYRLLLVLAKQHTSNILTDN